MAGFGDNLVVGSLKEQVVASLRTAILTGEMAPGTTYKMGEIAEQLGASRTPVREALMELESQGLVEISRSVGFRVTEPSRADLRDMYEIRLMLEVPSMGRIAGTLEESFLQRMWALIDRMEEPIASNDLVGYLLLDKEFHVALIEQTGNKRLTRLVSELRDWQRVPGLTRLARSGQLSKRNEEHRAILKAIEAGDEAAASRLTEQHISLSRRAWEDGE